MKPEIDIQFECEASLDISEDIESLMRRVCLAVFRTENMDDKNVYVSIVVTTDAQIQQINAEYRGIDEPTDVLSFPLSDGDLEDTNAHATDIPIVLGDIVISSETVMQQAKVYGHSVERELGFVTVHGLLHLLGYDHEKEDDRVVMRAKEEEILNRLDLTRSRG